jgi:hypothetical protein
MELRSNLVRILKKLEVMAAFTPEYSHIEKDKRESNRR